MIGIDGCKNGWIVAKYDEGFEVFFKEELSEVDNSSDKLIDIPVGIPETELRQCDKIASNFLAPERHYSVFACPVRAALESGNYEKAKKENQKVTGKKITKQVWNIRGKIKEAENFAGKKHLQESHPEVILKQLGGKEVVKASKKTDRGFRKRKQLIEKESGHNIETDLDEGSRDDVIDACTLAYASTKEIEKKPEKSYNSKGIEMSVSFLAKI